MPRSSVKNLLGKIGFTRRNWIIVGILVGVLLVVAAIVAAVVLVKERKAFAELEVMKQAQAELLLDATDIYYQKYEELNGDSPDYFEAMKEADSVYDLNQRWSAIDNAQMQKVRILQDNLNEVSDDCRRQEECWYTARDFFNDMENTLSFHEQFLQAWSESDSYKGNELATTANEYLDRAQSSLSDWSDGLTSWMSLSQFLAHSSFHGDAVQVVADEYQLIKTYCPEIDPDFHEYARYKTACKSSDSDSFIRLNKHDSYYLESPIKLTGSVSPNAQKIVVTARGGSGEDVYTLRDFSPGDTSFYYRASPELNNLWSGYNEFFFVVQFEGGRTQTTKTSISYYNYD
jgi:hypothetical protein